MEVEVLQEKVISKIEKNKEKVKAAIEHFERDVNGLNDYVVPLGYGLKEMEAVGSLIPRVVEYHSNGSVYMKINHEKFLDAREGRINEFTLHPFAVGQLGSKLKIPTGYLQGLVNGSDWEKNLCSKILQEHTDHTLRERFLIRSIDNEIRGVLSDQYRRMNSQQIIGQFLMSLPTVGAEIIDMAVTETKIFVEAIRAEILPIETSKNGVLYVVQGVRLRNSDFGDGALSLSCYTIQVVCMNGLTRENIMRKIHLGSKLPDDLKLSEKTYQLDTQTQASLVKDALGQLMTPAYFEKQKAIIQEASAKEVNPDKEFERLPKIGILKNEVEELKKVLMDNKVEDGLQGEMSLWKMVQGVSAVARSKNEERRRFLEEVAGDMLDKKGK